VSIQLSVAKNFSILVEDGFQARGPALMADSGDGRFFTCGGARFSLCEKDENGIDRTPGVRPDGVRNGCFVSAAADGLADAVDVGHGTAWIGYAPVTVQAAANVAVPRPASGMKKTSSVALDATGAVSVIGGTDGAGFSAARGAAGGPPFVPAGKIELATVALSHNAAAVKEEEISFMPEYSHAPEYGLSPYSCGVRFFAPLPAIHEGGVARNVWITWDEPIMAAVDAVSLRVPVAQNEIDPQTLKTVRRKIRPGLMKVPLAGNQGDLARRIDRTVRLFECRPDAAGNRRELFYAMVETSADYRPMEAMEGDLLLFAVEFPVAETF